MRRVAISASSRQAADAGARVADAGGNAVDVAVASTITGMVSEPGLIGPGAGCFLTIWPGDGRPPVVIDAYAAMPGLGSESPPDHFGDRVFMEYGGGMDTLVGPKSVAVPGAWAGFGIATGRYGSIEWPEIMRPAIDLTRDGFPLSPVSEAYLAYAHDPIYDITAESFAALHHPDGSRVADGDLIRIGGLAESLETIAAEGPDSFYSGSIGERLVEAMAEWGGSITRADLDAYEAIEREPIEVELAGWRVVTIPAPALGGAVLAAMILLAGRTEKSSVEDAVHELARSQRAVLRYRERELTGGSETEAAVRFLLDAAQVGDRATLLSSPSTIHVSAVDTDGTACAVTTSAGYGSGVMIPGTGLWLNNSLGEVELFPRGMDVFAPGDRLPSNMAPTIAASTGGAVMAVGSPGASRITTALAQVLVNFIVHGMSVTEAISHPRLHVETFDGNPTIAYEPGLSVEPFEDFRLRRFPDLSMYFGGVGLAMYDSTSGLYEAADPRRSGATAVGGL